MKKKRIGMLMIILIFLLLLMGCYSREDIEQIVRGEMVSVMAETAERAETDAPEVTEPVNTYEPESSAEQTAETTDETFEEAPAAEMTVPEEAAAARKSTNIREGLDASKPMIALTFDDGPYYTGTSEILDILEQYNQRATFFVIGHNAFTYMDLLHREVELGCEIGNHTYNHKKLIDLSDIEIKLEIEGVENLLYNEFGFKSIFLRVPTGRTDDRTAALAAQPIINWSIDTRDWETKDASSTIQMIQENVSDGDIVLMHDVYKETAEACRTIIPWLLEQNYQLVTVSELAYYKGVEMQSGQTYKFFR